MCPCATWWGVRRFVGESNGQSLLRSEATGERCHPPHHDTIGGTPPRGLGVSTVQEPEGPRQRQERAQPKSTATKPTSIHDSGSEGGSDKFSHKTYGILRKRDNAKVAVKSPPQSIACHPAVVVQPSNTTSPPPRRARRGTPAFARIRMESHGTIRIKARRRAPHTRGPGAAAPHHDHTISWPNLTAHCSGVAFHRNQSCNNARPDGRDDKMGLGRPANRYFSLRLYCLSHSRTTDSMPCMCKL